MICTPLFPRISHPFGSARSRPGREAAERTLGGEDRSEIVKGEGKGDTRYWEVAPDPWAAVESILRPSSEASATSTNKMKSKISIWDCRRAIEIAGGFPLTIRGDLFAGPGSHPVGRWFPETAVLVTQLEIKQGRWVIGNIRFYAPRAGIPHQTWRETSLRITIAYMPRNNRTSTRRVRVGSAPLRGLLRAFPQG